MMLMYFGDMKQNVPHSSTYEYGFIIRAEKLGIDFFGLISRGNNNLDILFE